MHYWADLQSVHGFRCYDNIKCKFIALYTANAYSAECEMAASACIRCMPGSVCHRIRGSTFSSQKFESRLFMTMTYRKHGREYHGGRRVPKICCGDANANCLPYFQKYCSEFTNIRHLKRKIHFFSGEGPNPLPRSFPSGLHSEWGPLGEGSGLGEEWAIPRPNQAFLDPSLRPQNSSQN